MKLLFNKLYQPSFDENSKDFSGKTGLLEQRYRQSVDAGQLHYDTKQWAVLLELQALSSQLQAGSRPSRLARKSPACAGIYLYGAVGCGKSMLMDLFFEQCPLTQKRRIHFHVFMQEVHRFIHQCRQQQDIKAVLALAKTIRRSYKLLCFDEFHVTDIADAMLLSRLFGELFRLGVVVVITSNRHPDDLYDQGLQRELFLPFIDLLKQTLDIQHLHTDKDYRRHLSRTRQRFYYYPLDAGADAFLQSHYRVLTHAAPVQSGFLDSMGRRIALNAVHKDVAMASFESLCVQLLGAMDYLYLAQRFKVILLAGIPRFSAQQHNEVKRFVTLIDVLYEHKISLICTAEVEVDELYLSGKGTFEFARTASRLMEMQSEQYRQKAKTQVE